MLRPDVTWRPVALVLALVVVLSLLWRRTHPLGAVLAVFGTLIVVDTAALVGGVAELGLYTTACVLLLPYALCRWGSGREVVLGLAAILVATALGIAGDYTGVAEAVLGGRVHPDARGDRRLGPAGLDVPAAGAGPGPAAGAGAAGPGAARHRGAPRLRDRRAGAGGTGGGARRTRPRRSTPSS